MKVHDIIRKIRQSQDMTQETLAEELGVDKTTIVRYEKDGSRIPIYQLEKIAKALGYSLMELLAYQERKSVVEEPFPPAYQVKRTITLSIELDGESSTVDFWIDKIKKLNAALA